MNQLILTYKMFCIPEICSLSTSSLYFYRMNTYTYNHCALYRQKTSGSPQCHLGTKSQCLCTSRKIGEDIRNKCDDLASVNSSCIFAETNKHTCTTAETKDPMQECTCDRINQFVACILKSRTHSKREVQRQTQTRKICNGERESFLGQEVLDVIKRTNEDRKPVVLSACIPMTREYTVTRT